AERPPRPHHRAHRADQPASRAAARWGRRRPADRPRRAALPDTVLAALARRRSPRDANRAQAVRHGELRRLAIAIRDGGRALKANRAQLHAIVDDLAPGLTDRRGVGPVSAAQVIVSFSHPGRCRSDAAFAALAGYQPT